jgi:hypothetical protein
MTNYLKLGAELLQPWMEQFGGATVTYRRKGEFSFQVEAVPGRNPVDVTDSNGVVLRGQVQDFTFSIDKLTAGMSSDPKRPLRNDEVVYQVGNQTVVFVVSGEDFSTSHYEPSDSFGVAWRVHTKSDRVL